MDPSLLNYLLSIAYEFIYLGYTTLAHCRHLPSNVFLLLVPLMPTLNLAILMVFLRCVSAAWYEGMGGGCWPPSVHWVPYVFPCLPLDTHVSSMGLPAPMMPLAKPGAC